MGQRKVYTEHTKKGIKFGNLLASLGIIVGFFMLFSKDNAELGVIFIVIGILAGFYYRICNWWQHG